ncbi:MAG: D-alanine--D-alanine ligase [Phycisphaeraceae bacterium]|nr:D-alanine--D-alanine ligase [Phycisphaeraceae bacterium]
MTTPPSNDPVSVLVLGGGPDAEREVSIKSATAIAEALRASGAYTVRLEIISTLSLDQLRALPADVVFPYLHGPWGEGGPLQDILELDGRPYVGSGPRSAREAMDKIATKAAALALGIDTPPVWILNPNDPVCPTALPVVIKPVHEGSTIGLHVCTSRAHYAAALAAVRAERDSGVIRTYMIEPKVGGQARARELTVGLLDRQALPVIEICPQDGLYDYAAKYTRDDTRYILDPDVPESVLKKISKATSRLARAMGLRHIARADFMLDSSNTPWFLEINTTPGFTDHSLVPKAARHAGIAMPELCARMVELALRDHADSAHSPTPAHAVPGASVPAP